MRDALSAVIGLAGLLWIAAFLCAIIFAITRRWRLLAISCATILGLTVVAFAAALAAADLEQHEIARRADEIAKSDARRKADFAAAHERKLRWQREHPAEYAQQRAHERAWQRADSLFDREWSAAEPQRLAAERAAEQQQLRAQRAAEREAARQKAAAAAADTPEGKKRQFLLTVNESISGSRIVANPYKFVGFAVDLRCVVVGVPQPGIINANCGGDSPLVILSPASDEVEKGQSIRVLGTVADPTEGTNNFGGQQNFPTVKAEFLQ